MLRLVLLTVGTWTASSFLFTWLWGTAILRISDPARYDLPTDPTAAQDITKTPPEGGLSDEISAAMTRRPLALVVQSPTEVTQHASIG